MTAYTRSYVAAVACGLCVNYTSSYSPHCDTLPSAFPFPDKEILHRVHSGGGLSRQNSNQSARATTPTTTMPSLLNVNDDMSVSILIMDVLIKQVDIIVLEKTFRNTVLI